MKTYNQSEHERINSREYPGTRQLCITCSEPTGRCEEDGIFDIDGNPYCESCADTMWYCENCNVVVEGIHVTYEETHDERFGGCGDNVVLKVDY